MKVQDGDAEIHSLSNAEGRLQGINISLRGLHTHPHKRSPLEAPTLCRQQSSLPVQGTSLWVEAGVLK